MRALKGAAVAAIIAIGLTAGCSGDEPEPARSGQEPEPARYESAREILEVVNEEVIACEMSNVDHQGGPETCSWEEPNTSVLATRIEAYIVDNAKAMRQLKARNRRLFGTYPGVTTIYGDRWWVAVFTANPDLVTEIETTLNGSAS